jgi:glycerate kinase
VTRGRARRIVFAPDSFKGSISARAAARALADGWLSVHPRDEVTLAPMADGGEGTLDAFEAAVRGATRIPVSVSGPGGAAVPATWLLLPPDEGAQHGTGVVELAGTSGIELLGSERLPWTAHTRGFGQAILAALDSGVSRLVLGIGSSASTDAGMGMLSELGARFTDDRGEAVADGAAGLARVHRADLSGVRATPEGGVVVLCDVTNPLFGPDGAASVFGPQKGMTPADVVEADAALHRFSQLMPGDPGASGAGAAGGVGFALRAWGAEIISGAAAVSALTGLDAAIPLADFVLTGEGSFDAQSASGKAPHLIARLAREAGVAVGLVAGRIEQAAALDGFAATASLVELAGSADAAMQGPEEWLRVAGRAVAEAAGRG